MTKIYTKNDRYILGYLVLNNISYYFCVQTTTIFKASKDNSLDRFCSLYLQKRLQVSIKFIAEIISHNIVIFQKQYFIPDIGHIRRSL